MPKMLSSLLSVGLMLTPQIPAGGNESEVDGGDGQRLVILSPGQVIDHDYFAVGESVEISGVVNGDVYAAGGSVLIDGTVNGDVLVAGGEIIISGTVAQDVRAVGGQMIISGTIGRNVTLGGGTVDLASSGAVRGGIVGGAGRIHLGGTVGKDVFLGVGRLVVSNEIGGHVRVAGGSIRLTAQAAVSGKVTYWSRHGASIDPQARVGGGVTQETVPWEFPWSWQEGLVFLAGVKLVYIVASFLSTLVLGLTIFRLYPRFGHQAINHLHDRPLAILGLGVLMVIIPPALIWIFALTVIGIPLALTVLAVYLVYLYLSRIFVMAWAGRRILGWIGQEHREAWAFVVGLVGYTILTVFPVVGILVASLVSLFGMGTLAYAKKDVYVKAREHGLI